VHRVLASLPLGAAEEAIRAAVAAYARVLGSTREEVETAVILVGRVLAIPMIRRAAEIESADPGAVRRELPLHTVSGDGSIVEGVADLAFRDPDVAGMPTWIVVDYKTDVVIGDARPTYEAQVAGYAAAVAAATGERALAVVLAT
jgi:ATP-dependent exoDNAse (exonuclease V) beta subunit